MRRVQVGIDKVQELIHLIREWGIMAMMTAMRIVVMAMVTAIERRSTMMTTTVKMAIVNIH